VYIDKDPLIKNTEFWPHGEQPENIRLETLYVGSPPVVTLSNEVALKRDEKALTDEVALKRDEKALTDKGVTKKSSFVSELLSGWGDDDE